VVRSTIGEALVNLDRLHTALDCLVENAVKFTKPGDRIEVIGGGATDTWTITVADSGPGMTPERVAEVTAGGPTALQAVKQSGTGLGLAIVRAVVGSWGGRLEVHSVFGAGTTVTLTFPRVAARHMDIAADLAVLPPRAISPIDA
jgi:signal transduction histidine kinase